MNWNLINWEKKEKYFFTSSKIEKRKRNVFLRSSKSRREMRLREKREISLREFLEIKTLVNVCNGECVKHVLGVLEWFYMLKNTTGLSYPPAFLKKYFFQRACRIILGPPKHVLHLVWSPFVIYTAIKTALKEAWEARFLGKRRSESKNKKIKFWNGTKCKICFTHLWSYFRKKK